MEKLKCHTPDFTAANVQKLAALFPNCVTEARDEKGALTRLIDFDQLRQELSASVVEGPRERYHLDWPGKREALLAANAPIAKTLRPCREESVNFDTTKNLFIEGDNLDALKLLQETYLGRVKMIYIDPPYNTGNDFIYDDDFTEDSDSYFVRSNQRDADGNRMVANTVANGRFHSDWISMIYPRLKLASSLLRDDGIIFISIDDVEAANLKKVCDEVFGESNFVASISRVMKSGGAKAEFFTPNVEFILVYAKELTSAIPFRAPLTQDQIDVYYKMREPTGPRAGEIYGEERLYKASLDPRPNQRYWIQCPDGSFVIPPGKTFPNTVAHGEKIVPTPDDGVWKWIFERYRDEFAKNNIVFKETETSALVDEHGRQSKWNIYNKVWLKEQQAKGVVPSNLITRFENRQSAAELKELGIPFDFAKPTELLRYLLQICRTSGDDIVVDFFAGSGTLGHATMAQNSVDGMRRRFILIQLHDPLSPTNNQQKIGADFCDLIGKPRNLAELAKERLRRAADKIKRECPMFAGDLGFRVLRCDTSNMADVYYAPDVVKQSDLVGHTDNIKSDRTPEDLLFQVLVDWGVDLALPIARETIAGKSVFFVDGNALAACFDASLSEELVKELARRQPLRAVFRDSSYGSDSVKINVEQIFKLLSPTTELKSL
jgi:adenine-specific DNA-methyltransferase